MNKQEVFDWCRQRYGTEPDYPWKDWNTVLHHADNYERNGIINILVGSKIEE